MQAIKMPLAHTITKTWRIGGDKHIILKTNPREAWKLAINLWPKQSTNSWYNLRFQKQWNIEKVDDRQSLQFSDSNLIYIWV